MNLVFHVVVMALMFGTQSKVGSSCETSLEFNGSRRSFAKCLDLGAQGASLAWNVTQRDNGTELEVAFSGVAPTSGGWVGWGLNPDIGAPKMAGSSVFIAFHAANGSTLLPYQLTATTMSGAPLTCSPINYVVEDSALEISNTSMVMLIRISLSASQTPQLNAMNHVWNRGSSVDHFRPAPHATRPTDLKTVARIDMTSTYPITSPPPSTKENMRNSHAILNIVSWGILLPSGVLAARYFKLFSTTYWFYLHKSLQCIGYVLGVSGWVTGVKLDNESNESLLKKHGNIGMVLFAFSTLQVMSLLLRPSKEHKLRVYWNVYHHGVGYSVVVLGILNVFVGFSILHPNRVWSHAYICVLVTLGGISLALEALTWMVFLKKGGQEGSIGIAATTYTTPFGKDRDRKITGSYTPTSPPQHILRVL